MKGLPKSLLAPAEACKVETDCINSIRFLAVDAVNKASVRESAPGLDQGARLSTEIAPKISCQDCRRVSVLL